MKKNNKKKRKKGVAAKPKGSSWERDLANKLTESTGKEFRRVPLSGAWMGGQNRAKNESVLSGAQEGLSGDIMGPDGWPFSIECKNTASYPRFHLMLQSNDAKVDEYLSQAMEDAHHTNKLPILAIKRTRRGEFIMVPRFLELLAADAGAPDPESYPHMLYIFKGTSDKFRVYYEWIMMEAKVFIYNANSYWKAGSAALNETDLEYFQKNVRKGLRIPDDEKTTDSEV